MAPTRWRLSFYREPLHLRREPNNPYDRNAIAVHTVPGSAGGGKRVGHVEAKTGDVAAITRVADGLRVKLVGQVEKGASQVYKFPLRVSFFGAPSDRERIRQLLGYQLQLIEPKRAPGKQRAGAKKSSGSAAGSSAGGVEGAAGRADEAGEDDVEVTGETSWEERDTELRKHAIELE